MFISYAQNFEDVMLWRALKHVENGFYIDVGANDPTAHSVTKAFYERGWRGINIEPLSSHYLDLIRERPNDINLQCAAGAAVGEVELWEADVRGWATAEKQVIEQHKAAGHKGIWHKVPVVPLKNICKENVAGEIHFLKIDVEGFEKYVLEGMDFSRFRPWVLIVEATEPNTSEENHVEWEGIVLAMGYIFAYADGLNRFYVATEHHELLLIFKYPPNVFDNFIQVCDERTQQAVSRAEQAESTAEQAERKLAAVYLGLSWRVTKPLRAVERFLQMIQNKLKSGFQF